MRSAVSAIMATVTPGMARTAASAAARTLSQARASAASTLIEKKTLPSLTVMADSTLALVKATPRGDITLASPSSTCCCVTLDGASPGSFTGSWHQNRALLFVDAFSSREPGTTSLENAILGCDP